MVIELLSFLKITGISMQSLILIGQPPLFNDESYPSRTDGWADPNYKKASLLKLIILRRLGSCFGDLFGKEKEIRCDINLCFV